MKSIFSDPSSFHFPNIPFALNSLWWISNLHQVISLLFFWLLSQFKVLFFSFQNFIAHLLSHFVGFCCGLMMFETSFTVVLMKLLKKAKVKLCIQATASNQWDLKSVFWYLSKNMKNIYTFLGSAFFLPSWGQAFYIFKTLIILTSIS